MSIELTTTTAETLSGIREALSIPTKPAKDEADVLNLESYGPTIHGALAGTFVDKFQSIEQAGAGILNFSVAGGTVNSSPICPSILGDLSSTIVNASNLEMRDDGEGSYYSNYITYLNRVFERLGLYSTLSSRSDRRVIMKYYRSEDFDLIFKETTHQVARAEPVMYWRWKTINGLGVKDTLGSKSPKLISRGILWGGSIRL